MKIKSALTLIIMWFAVSGVSIFLVLSSIMLGRTAEEKYVNLVSTAANAQAANVELYINSLESSFAALTEIISTLNQDEREEFLLSYVENHGGISHIGINRLLSGENDIDITPILDFEHDGKVHIVPLGQVRSQYGLAAKASVGGDTLIAVFYNDTVNTIIGSAELTAYGRLVLIDPAGGVMDNGEFMGELSQLAQFSSDARRYTEHVEFGEVQRLMGNTGNSAVYRAGGSMMTVYINPIGDSQWTAVVFGDISAARGLASDSLRGLRTLVIILSIAGIVLAIALTWRLTKPLDIILETLAHARRGDRNARIDVKANNEFGEISKLCNKLINESAERTEDES